MRLKYWERKETFMKRIVMVIGGVETLEYFSYQMGKTFEENGFLVFYYDLKNEEQSARRNLSGQEKQRS